MKENIHDDLLRFKEELISSGYFKHMNTVQYTSQCPYCLDNRQHCYVKIDTSSDIPVVYWCHKCTAHGIVGKDFLDRLNIDIKVPKYTGSKPLEDNRGVSINIRGDTVTERDYTEKVKEYIHGRVGHYPTLEELKMFWYIGNPRAYATEYLGYNGEGRPFNNRFWFKLTNHNMIGRWKDDNTDFRWMNFKTNRVRSGALYTFNQGINPLEDITVVIAEGIMDVIGLYYNKKMDNALYVASLGKGHERAIRLMINKGIFGDSVNVKIFRDPNVKDNEVYVPPLMMQMFNSVELYHNDFDKDYGVTPDLLDIHKSLNWKGGFKYEPNKGVNWKSKSQKMYESLDQDRKPDQISRCGNNTIIYY